MRNKTRLVDPIEGAAIIRNGGLVAFPTETVYGLGANGLDEAAVARIYEAKGRPNDNPLILHVASFDELVDLSSDVPLHLLTPLFEAFMPGALTVVLPRADCVPYCITAGLETVAVRIPENAVALELLRAAGVPIAAPSANASGRPSPTKAQHVLEDLDGKIDGIIDGGACKIGLESTILDLTADVPTVLRQGGVSVEELREVIGDVAVAGEGNITDIPKAPGMKYRHYAPKAQVYIVYDGFDMEFDEGVKVFTLHACEDLEVYASQLFDKLRSFDEQGADVILVEPVPEIGIGAAIMNRIRKAAMK